MCIRNWGAGQVALTYQTGGAGRPLSAVGSFTFATNAHYTPAGALCSMQNNWGSIFTTNATFNNRLQPVRMQTDAESTPPSGTPCALLGTTGNQLDLSYSFTDASGHNNGNVTRITNNSDADRTQNFTYDSLNRVATAQTAGTNQPAFSGDTDYLQECWGEQFGYDPWGNLTTISAVSTAYNGCTQESLNLTGFIGANNRITASGYVYDAAGNMISAPPTGTNYTYDAENHLLTAGGVTYTYDGDGKRVKKSNGTLYWYGAGSDASMETDLSNNMQFAYFFFNGKRIARVAPNNQVNWFFTDHLGTSRVVWTPAGKDESDFYPFGGERVLTTGTPTHYKFTGKERDSESGNDYFGARHYSSSFGRFMQPDPSPMGIAMADPQSWNLYSYVRNRPTRSVDVGGNWATDIHAEIVTFALQGYISAGELQQLVNRQYVMDSDQSTEHQYMHAMRNGMSNQSPDEAVQLMWKFVADNMDLAKANMVDGQFTQGALNHLGDAIHTLEDLTSPMHTSGGEPLPWFGMGGVRPAFRATQHWVGENSPDKDWAAIGFAVRLTMAAYMQANPSQAARNGLTEATFNNEVNKRISGYVDWFYRSDPGQQSMEGGKRAIAEDAARQCALGNPAACN